MNLTALEETALRECKSAADWWARVMLSGLATEVRKTNNFA